MRWLVLLFPILSLTAQDFKSEISVVQFSAPFTQDSEISLKPFKSYNTYTFHITDKQEIFDSEEIKRIESGISLKLPDDSVKKIQKEIDKIIESKF